MTMSLRYAARSDVGLLREGNEDSGYAGPRLLAVADGMGGHAAGEVASSVAVATLSALDEDVPGPDLLGALATAIRTANAHLRDMVAGDEALEGMGTTLTALLWAGGKVGLAHIGDSRAYLLRGGELQQITHDHTFVQSLVDEGRITAEEAEHHPQRSLILRALDGRGDAEPDLSVREVRVGDRYLLCSDGLSGVVSEDTMAETLSRGTPAEAVDALVQLALRGGGPDNITCIVADVVDLDDPGGATGSVPVVVGAAGDGSDPGVTAPAPDTPAARARALAPEPLARPGGAGPDPDDADAPKAAGRSGWTVPLLLAVVLVAVVGGGAYAAYAWSQQQYFVGEDAGAVAVYRGVHQTVAGRNLSTLHHTTDVRVTALPDFQRQRVAETIAARDLSDAQRIVDRLRADAQRCAAATATPAPAATPRPTAQPTAVPTPPATAAVPAPTHSPVPTPSPTPTRPAGCGEEAAP